MADFTAGRAAYLQIADEFKRKIRDGELAPGDKLPSEAELMTKHGVSRTVARQAISRLREDGYAISHQGKGSFAALPGEGASAKRSTEFEQITEYLSEVRRDVRRLAERMDQLEDLVRQQGQAR
ncbi:MULTISPECIES: winged helix-turn-helix domain-containing protein [unclassified Streptomyces]|uniref:winged helix-turn-helix domain-containing protein n=1 Tax=unclassified Streptomyces TaxID=2593676 RepID=UPI000CDD118D|nr:MULTISPECIES: winged helix-turn-helix domain-containing protein [unclassified Streptomyces]MYV48194.1 GntR family transcriptional regulator [Streptomyces sp. SID2888]POX52609.1 GntR family transcriptional regulator [Streptomyces sp. Ru72]